MDIDAEPVRHKPFRCQPFAPAGRAPDGDAGSRAASQVTRHDRHATTFARLSRSNGCLRNADFLGDEAGVH